MGRLRGEERRTAITGSLTASGFTTSRLLFFYQSPH